MKNIIMECLIDYDKLQLRQCLLKRYIHSTPIRTYRRKDVIYIDESRAEGSGRLIISKGQSVKLLEEADLSTSDLVILMSVWQRNDQGDLCRGIVADCRFYSGRLMLNMATKRLMITMELMMKSTIRTTSRLFLQ